MQSAHIEIFADAHVAEQIATFRRLNDAAARDRRRRAALQARALAADVAAIRHEARDRVEQGGLARPV
jgi:hypothetical protein